MSIIKVESCVCAEVHAITSLVHCFFYVSVYCISRLNRFDELENFCRNNKLFSSLLQADEQTGFKTKSILCMPIKNAEGRVMGVSQLINKKDGTPFTKNDENLFEVHVVYYVLQHEAECITVFHS